MTTAELIAIVEELRRAGSDTHRIEARRAERDLLKWLWETLSSLANTRGGGVIILGLDQEYGFAVSGMRDAARLMQELASLAGEMEPPIRAVIDIHTVESKAVVVAEIPETMFDQKPCYFPSAGLTNGAFIRVGDGDRRLSPYEVQLMLASRGQPREDETPVVEASRDDLDQELVAGLLKRLRQPESSHFRRLDDERALQVLKVLVRHEEGWVPSLGGLLALGTYPQQFFPSLRVTFLAHPTPVMGVPGPRGERFVDNRSFDGPIPRIIRPLLDAVERHLARRSIVEGAFRRDEWEYPEEAIREALVNALAHRDLSPAARGTPVQGHLFPDRLTITNPGGLYGPVSVDRLGEAGIAATRNQVLMRLLEDTTTPGEGRLVCENRGSGISAMLTALRLAGLPAPRFVDQISTFTVTFASQPVAPEQRGTTRRWGDRTEEIVGLLRQHEVMTRAEIAAALGLSDVGTRKWLSRLRDEGLIEMTTLSPRSRETQYRLARAGATGRPGDRG